MKRQRKAKRPTRRLPRVLVVKVKESAEPVDLEAFARALISAVAQEMKHKKRQ